MTSDNIGRYDDGKRKLLSDALGLFYNAQVTEYARKGNVIEISYKINEQAKTIKYDTKRGILL